MIAYIYTWLGIKRLFCFGGGWSNGQNDVCGMQFMSEHSTRPALPCLKALVDVVQRVTFKHVYEAAYICWRVGQT